MMFNHASYGVKFEDLYYVALVFLLSRATHDFTKGGHSECFYASIVMHDRVGEYELEDNICVMA